jgi:hypothetical protein
MELLEQDKSRVGLLNGDDMPTYIDRRVGSVSMLDLCLGLYSLIVRGDISGGPDIGSDHFPIYCSFEFQIEKKSACDKKKVEAN